MSELLRFRLEDAACRVCPSLHRGDAAAIVEAILQATNYVQICTLARMIIEAKIGTYQASSLSDRQKELYALVKEDGLP